LATNQEDLHYYFKLKHNIQNDSELALSKLEVEKSLGQPCTEIINFVDVLSREPLIDFVSDANTRTQDFITRLPYPGAIQGYQIRASPRDCISLATQITYFREFYVLTGSDRSLLQELLPGVSLEGMQFDKETRLFDMLPYVQAFTVCKKEPRTLLRILPLHTLYEPSDFICRLAMKTEHVDRMFQESIHHVQTEIYRPYSSSSARWFKRIADFMDSREAPQLYLTHYIFGIHGKFFPRMIGAIMNSMNISKGDCILDPFCGSGTLNVESTIRGIDNIGIDMQPLFTMITRLKTESIHWKDEWLKKNIEQLLQNIQVNLESGGFLHDDKINKLDNGLLPKSLMRGIRKDSLAFVGVIKSCIEEGSSETDDKTAETDLQNFCKLPLAYWMRSFLKKQEPKKILQTYGEYLWKMFYSVYYFHQFENEICKFKMGKADVYTRDVRNLIETPDSRIQQREIDGIITSPPYGTAIDYVRDHVWALYMLGLSENHRRLDEEHQIGTQHASRSNIKEIEERSEDFLSLPEIAQRPLTVMVQNHRQDKASAFYRYFVDMRDAFEQMSEVLRSGKQLVLIVGKQQSVGSEKGDIVIELGKIMEEIGRKKPSELEYLSSIDIALQKASQRGAIPTEHVIFFKKK